MLLYLNDKSLNKFMPLKRLAPYREPQEEKKSNKFMNKKKLGDLARELERKKVTYTHIYIYSFIIFRKRLSICNLTTII